MDIQIEPRYMDLAIAAKYIGISRAYFYRLIGNDPTFPKGIRLTATKRVYDKKELDLWVDSKRVKNDQAERPNQDND